MKILAVFIDMLRMEQVYTKDSGWKNKEFETFFEGIGGTLYSACYTPSPDSYRSMGCFWSSQYPLKNGCNRRSGKTYDYLKNPENSLLGLLKSNGYQFNSFVGLWANNKIGLLPDAYDMETDNLSTGLFQDEWLESVKVGDNSFTFINYEDLHEYLEDGNYEMQAFRDGAEKIISLMERLFRVFPAVLFDEIVFFSDHGFRYYFEKPDHLLDEKRSRVFLFWHHKGDKGIRIDHNLRSIMDVYPSLLEQCSIEYDKRTVTGKNLFRTNGHKFLMFEEHGSYYSGYLEPVCQWAVADRHSRFVFINDHLEWTNKNGNEAGGRIKDHYEPYLMKEMTNYKDLKEMMARQAEYRVQKTNTVMSKYYSDGELRVRKKISMMHRMNIMKRHAVKMLERIGVHWKK